MKSIACFSLLFTFCLSAVYGQEDYKVIKVNGSIMLKTRGISLETGTVFSEREDLLFRTDDATAAVINSQKGRLVLTSRSHDLATAKSNYLPSMYNISSRGTKFLTANDISGYFTGKLVVLDKQGIQVDDVTFPMNKENFFFLRYLYKGEEINKKLACEGNTFYIDKSALFTIDGNPIPSADNTKIRLYYRKGKESLFLSEFDLVFPDMKQLARETEIILNEIKTKSAKEKSAEVGSYITEMYGKVPAGELSGWLESEFGVK